MEELPRPEILLLHDGDLADVRELLGGLDLEPVERCGAPTGADLAASWDLVVGNPQRLLELERGQPGAPSTRVAILADDSATLRTALRRAGVDYTVRRPVHPEALRLLLLHTLYRGPEKRRQRRVSIGASVRFRIGWRRGLGVLADLSVTGCRLLTHEPVRRGRRVRLQVPSDVAGGRALRVRGTVVRCEAAEGAPDGTHTVALAFEALSASGFQRLGQIVSRYREGPAIFGESRAKGEDSRPERRRDPRHELSRHIIALGSETAPVLMGRDISLGGMRVDPHPSVSIGDALELAIHVRARENPLVVKARVARDDGPRGFVLEFCDLSDASREYLEKMVNFLPILAQREGERGGEAGVIFSQILQQTPA